MVAGTKTKKDADGEALELLSERGFGGIARDERRAENSLPTEQVAAANAHGRHASCCAGDRARRGRG
jgi:hypothetical protein